MQVEDSQDTFDDISFTDLILHTLLDMFEFSAHSFEGFNGPYFWNGIGIDFESPLPIEEVLAHTKERKAKKIYVAHTHPLSNDASFKFLHVKVDPREEVAYGCKPLPIGNPPSSGDISFFNQLRKKFKEANIQVVGVVFSASGLWEFTIADTTIFNTDEFAEAYGKFYPLDTSSDFLKEWSARGDFPSYYMELQKPKMHTKAYKTQITKTTSTPTPKVNVSQEIARAIGFFNAHGVNLAFYPYLKFGIDPQALMRRTLNQWTDKFID